MYADSDALLWPTLCYYTPETAVKAGCVTVNWPSLWEELSPVPLSLCCLPLEHLEIFPPLIGLGPVVTNVLLDMTSEFCSSSHHDV